MKVLTEAQIEDLSYLCGVEGITETKQRALQFIDELTDHIWSVKTEFVRITYEESHGMSKYYIYPVSDPMEFNHNEVMNTRQVYNVLTFIQINLRNEYEEVLN